MSESKAIAGREGVGIPLERDTDLMPEGNVELVRQMLEAFNRRDLTAYLALMDDQVEIESRLIAIEGGYHGHEGVRRWWDNLFAAFPDYMVEVQDVGESGEVAIARMVARSHGAESEAPLVETLWLPGRFRHGKCVWWRVCTSEAEALETAGLSPG